MGKNVLMLIQVSFKIIKEILCGPIVINKYLESEKKRTKRQLDNEIIVHAA